MRPLGLLPIFRKILQPRLQRYSKIWVGEVFLVHGQRTRRNFLAHDVVCQFGPADARLMRRRDSRIGNDQNGQA